jgi:hypothetical protein
VRIREHKHNFREGLLERSRLAQHAYEEDHSENWDGIGILGVERNCTIRKYKEAAHNGMGGKFDQPTQPGILSYLVFVVDGRNQWYT